jgi:hypothetical protein
VGLPRFDRALTEAEESVEMRPKPMLKNIEGNDEATLSGRQRPAAIEAPKRAPSPSAAPAARAAAPAAKASPERREKPERAGAAAEPPRRPKAGRINVAIGDDGVKDLGAARRMPKAEPENGPSGEGEQKAIDDVTRLIREKLKNLRSI